MVPGHDDMIRARVPLRILPHPAPSIVKPTDGPLLDEKPPFMVRICAHKGLVIPLLCSILP